MEKLYYTISETAEALGTSVSLVRFWSNSFPKYINPARNAKGNRLYTAKDLDTLRQIQYLVKVKGLTLEGAAKQRRGKRRSVQLAQLRKQARLPHDLPKNHLFCDCRAQVLIAEAPAVRLEL